MESIWMTFFILWILVSATGLSSSPQEVDPKGALILERDHLCLE